MVRVARWQGGGAATLQTNRGRSETTESPRPTRSAHGTARPNRSLSCASFHGPPAWRHHGQTRGPASPGETTGKGVRLATMHRVKGLEFPRMILASVHQGEMPLALPPEAVPDEAALKNHEESERRLLYVAATRARDFLLIPRS